LRFRAAGFALTRVSAAFFFVAVAALTIGLRVEACRLFFSALMMSRRGTSSTFSNSRPFLPLIFWSNQFPQGFVIVIDSVDVGKEVIICSTRLVARVNSFLSIFCALSISGTSLMLRISAG